MQLVAQEPSWRRRARLVVAGAARLARSPRQLRALLRRSDDPRAFQEACWAWIAVGQVAGLAGAAKR
jgi:hypothetical protein